MTFVSSSTLFAGPRREQNLALDGERQVQFDELRASVAIVCSHVQRSGLKRWGVSCKNAHAFIAAFFGVLHAGQTAVLPPFGVIGTSERELLGCQGLFTETPGQGFEVELNPLALSGMQASLSPIPLDTACIELFTSGSTGQPKQVIKTLGNLDVEVSQLEKLWGSSIEGARFVPSVGPQHIYGLLFRVLWPLCSGRPVLADTIFYPEELLPWIQSQPSVLIGSPALFKRLVDFPELQRLLSGCALVLSSGGVLPPQVFEVLSANGAQVREIFGSTESGGIAWRCDCRKAWMLFDLVDASETGGRLLVESPYIAQGGCVLEDSVVFETPRTFRHCGRTDRIVKIEEKRVSLDDIEKRVLETGLVRECAAVAVGRHGRVRIGLVVVAGPRLTEADILSPIRHALRSQLDAVLLPRYIRVVPVIPVNTQGKRQSSVLERFFDHAMPLVRTVDKQGAELRVELSIPHDLTFFSGHFPGHPIVPGFMQISWAATFAQQYLQLNSVFCAKSSKFRRALSPGDSVHLILCSLEQGGVSFEFRVADSPVTSGQFLTGNVR